jgi:hypothetical protein
MTSSVPDVITRYFAAQSARDFDALLPLFADDAYPEDVLSPLERIRARRTR